MTIHNEINSLIVRSCHKTGNCSNIDGIMFQCENTTKIIKKKEKYFFY